MKLKLSLLLSILENKETSNKYSKSFLNLKNVLEIETKINKQYYKDFEKLEKEYNNFINNIPIDVIEKYLIFSKLDINDFAYILYKGNEISEYTLIELYNRLELFYNKIFNLACKIANYYNLEIKFTDLETENINIDKI